MQGIALNNNQERKAYLPIVFLSLFTSMGTLLCCALPALFVAIGMGAVVAGMATNIPGLVTLSLYKGQLFLVSFILLSFTGFMLYRSRNMPCPIDPIKRRACLVGRKVSFWVYMVSLVTWVIGFFFAYILVQLL
jgi:hypothetical protein